MKRGASALGALGLVLLFTTHGGAYRFSGSTWKSGSSIVMHLQQGSSSGALIDGSPDWNTVSEGALATWNPFIGSVDFRVVRDSTAAIAQRNGVNNVVWADDVYGEPFGDAVAMTVWFSSGNTTTESDVIFNRHYSWNSYRGNLRSASSGGWLYDLRRVALHEFGHVLGLDHPDQHGQSVLAIMNSRTSDIDNLQSDDTSGVRGLYGSSPPPATNHPPTVTASCVPSCTVQTGMTTNLVAAATDPDGDALSYQWTVSQGTITNPNAATTVWTAPSQPGGSTAAITVQDSRGARSTASIALLVVPRDRLQAGGFLLVGQSLISSNGRYRLVYQSDGNLVLYDDVARIVLWSSGTSVTNPGQAVLQGDGNFVIYDTRPAPLWNTGTAGNASTSLVVQNDGNVVLYRSNGQPAWDRVSAGGGQQPPSPAPLPTPTPTPAPAPPAAPTATGTWTGRAISTSCRDDGAAAGFCQVYPAYSDSLALRLSQTITGSVTGVIDVGGYPVNASGSLQGDRLQINGTGTVNGVEYEYKAWNATISGSSMTGGFSFLEYVRSGGSVTYTMVLVNVVRTSTSTSTPALSSAEPPRGQVMTAGRRD